MSLFAKIALGVLVVAGVGFGAWDHSQKQEQRKEEERASQADVSATINLSAGDTNADLDADLRAIDGQLNVISNTSTDIDQSMNDTPTVE